MFGRKTKLAIALAALHVYADEAFWKRKGTSAKGNFESAPFTADHGETARNALRRIHGPVWHHLFRRRPVDLGELRVSGNRIQIHVPAPRATEDLQ